MPKSIHSDISPEAVGEALLQHYNVGIQNPWHRVGLSDQETYNRRKLPWSGKEFEVRRGEVVGITGDVSEVPDNLQQMWLNFAAEATDKINGPYDGLKDLHEDLTDMNPEPVTGEFVGE